MVIAANDGKINVKLSEFSDSKAQGNAVFWNPFEALKTVSNKGNGITLSAATILEHEMDHAVRNIKKPDQVRVDNQEGSDPQYDTKEESSRAITGSEMKTGNLNGEIPKGEYKNDHGKGGDYQFIKVSSPILTNPLIPFKIYDPKHEKN